MTRDTAAFPPQNRLIVTTTRGVYIWDRNGISQIFQSGSEGIVAAKQLENGGDMLAVADSHIVVLHEITGGIQKSYRLKGSQGRVRLLQYAKASDQLFFTTELQNSVQSYSIQDSLLVDTSHSHPTPPSVFAISCNSQFLLSTSIAPPTIHLTDLSLNMLPILVRPQCSSSAVVAAAFHPQRANYFLLAFADGTAAVFDAIHFFRKQDKRDHGSRAANVGAGGVLAFLKGLHAQGTTTSSDEVPSNGVDIRTGVVGIGDKSWGITAVAFVPGRKATAVTVGSDGKCCLVDFTQPTKPKAILLRSWHLRRPATSLSVICSVGRDLSQEHSSDGRDADPQDDFISRDTMPKYDGSEAAALSKVAPDKAYRIAVGRQDGRVLLFDLQGKYYGEQTFDEKGTRVVDVEWTTTVKNSKRAVDVLKTTAPLLARSPRVKMKRKSLGTIVMAQGHPAEDRSPPSSSTIAKESEGDLFDFTTPVRAATNYLDIAQRPTRHPEPNVTNHDKSKTSPSTTTTPIGARRRRVVTPSRTKPLDVSTPPYIPPRPTPKAGGLLMMRRAQSALRKSPNDSYSSLVASARKVKTSPPARGMGPRPMPSPNSNGLRVVHPTVDSSSENINDDWVDIPPTPPLHIFGVQSRSVNASSESFQTAPSTPNVSGQSEQSSDVVIDWNVESPRRPLSFTEEQTQVLLHTLDTPKPKRKGHINLSISSTVQEAIPTSKHLEEPLTAIIQWPADSPVQPPQWNPLKMANENPANPQPKKKGHVSIPSFSSDDTVTPMTSSSEDPVVQWPKLKKSTRMLGLNKAVPDSAARESATESILDGYMASPPRSPPKVPRTKSPTVEHPVAEHQTGISFPEVSGLLDVVLAGLRAELKVQFGEQKLWLEGLVKGADASTKLLAEENRSLRAELERLLEGKEASISHIKQR